MTWILVGIAGSLGALARFELGSWVAEHTQSPMPVGTLVVNTCGSLMAGLAWALDLPEPAGLVISVGFLGGFTTFSTWMVETGRLLEDDERPARGLANLALMLLGGLLGVLTGVALR